MKAVLLYITLLLISLSGFAQIPSGYYNSAAGLTGTPLQQALHDIIDNHTILTYGSLFTHFSVTDVKPDNSVWDMYSDVPGGTPPYVYHFVASDQCGNPVAEGDCFNREHSWPKSWFGGDILPMYTDLFHLYPTDGWVNNKRGNLPYGTVGTANWTSQNGSRTGNCNWPGYSGVVFEPINEYKGDFARTYFYMAVRYFTEDASWPDTEMATGSQLKPWAASMLLQWSQDDTVSQKEIDRNNAVYQIQGNRNPFIDNPQYILDIWGPGAGIESHADFFYLYPNPASAQCRIMFPGHWADQPADILIYNQTGMLVNTFEKQAGISATLNLQGIRPGVYIIRANFNGKAHPARARIVVL
ncbi:MAG: endonuclease [Bacteroidales bacterium]